MSNLTEQDERDFKNHKAEFDRICDQYNLRGGEKAGAIADFLVGAEGGVNPEEFATKFEIEPVDAIIFLSWINVGLRYDRCQSINHISPTGLFEIKLFIHLFWSWRILERNMSGHSWL